MNLKEENLKSLVLLKTSSINIKNPAIYKEILINQTKMKAELAKKNKNILKREKLMK